MASGNILHSECFTKDPRIETLVQKLEETCKRVLEDEPIAFMKKDKTSSAYIPMRIRDIVQETLSPLAWGRPLLTSSLSRENSNLLKELDKAQDLLSQSRKECHDLGVKYITVSEKVEKVSGLEKLIEELHLENKQLQQELAHLREVLASKEEAHGIHLRAYQDTHQRQEEQLTLLEARLADYQAKYLEMNKMLEKKEAGFLEADDDIIGDLEAKIADLESKLLDVSKQKSTENLLKEDIPQQRTVELAVSNQRLRDQLQGSQETNVRLMDSVHELTFRWRESQTKLEERERVWREKMETQSSKSAQSYQNNLTAFFRDVANVKDTFSSIVSSIHKELVTSQEELKLTSEQLSTCVETETRELRNINEMLMLELQQKEQELSKLTTEMADMAVEQESVNAKHQLIITSYEDHFCSLGSSLKEATDENDEKSKTLETLEVCKTELEFGKSNLAEQLVVTEMNLSQSKEDLNVLKSCIDSIVEVFLPPATQPSDASHQHQQVLPLQPKLYDTPEDVKRVRDWAISVVQCGVNTRDKTVQELKSEVDTLQGDLDSQAKRLSEVDQEVKAHSASNQMLTEELNSCKDNLKTAERDNNEFERQLEEANSKRLEAEHGLKQNMARVCAMMQEKEKVINNNFILQDTVSKMKYELEKVKDEKQSQEMDLTSKHNASKRLELHFRGVEDEAKALRERIGELESIKQGLERELSQGKMQAVSFQMEKETFQTELKSLRDSEAAAITTLDELKLINKNLESDKRQLTKSLKEASSKKTKLDQENVALEKIRVENEDELQRLKGANVHLTDQVGQLDRSLDESEHLRSEIHNERDCLRMEVAALSEALGKTKHALAEVQIQRGKLNNIIAKMAQEKGELVQDKVSCDTAVTKLQETLRVSDERVASLKVANERLELKVEELENRVMADEAKMSNLGANILSLQQEKHQILVEKDNLVREKNDEMRRKLNVKDTQLQNTLMHAKMVEAEFQSIMQQEKVTAQQTIQDLKEAHENEITLLKEQYHDETVQLQEEIELTVEAGKTDVAKLTREKDLLVVQFSEEKSLLEKRLDKIQNMFEEKCEEIRVQYEKSSHLAAEQKAQLNTSTLNAQRLESELSTAEHHIQSLQNKLDEVKKEAEIQAESMREKFREATSTSMKLESSYSNSLMTLRNLEGQRDTLQRQTSDLQRELESVMQEKGELQTRWYELRNTLNAAEREMARTKETISSLQSKLKKSEEARNSSERDAESAHATLTKVENLHAKLVSDHASLQALLTNSEKEKSTFQLDLRSAQEQIARLERQRQGLVGSHAALESQLKVATKTTQLKEKEIAGFRQRAVNLERERNELNLNLLKVQETLCIQGKVDAATKIELQSQVSELKSVRDSLKEEINSLKISLTTTQDQISENEFKLHISSGQASSLSTELKKIESMYRDLTASYTELVAVLKGTLGLAIIEEGDPEFMSSFNKDMTSHAESGMGESLPTSLQSSFLGGFGSPEMTSVRIDATAVSDAILDLQRKASLSDKVKSDALSSVSKLEKKISHLEEEKVSLEARLLTLRSSLTTVQGNLDTVSRQRDAAEMSETMQKKAIILLEESKEQLEFEVESLREQTETNLKGRQESELKLKWLTSAQAGSEASCKQHEMHALELQLQNKQKDETIFKQKALISKLQSSRESRDAEVMHLQQKLASSQQSCKMAEDRLKNINKSVKDVDSSLRISKGRESKLLEKIRELEEDLLDAKCQKVSLNRQLEDLNDDLAKTKKEQSNIEENLSVLTQTQVKGDKEKVQLQEKIKQLEDSLSYEVKNRSELTTRLQSMEMRMQQREDEKKKMELKIMMLMNDKEQLSSQIRQIEEDMEAASKGKQIASELCSSLESEKGILQRELQVIREENLQLKGELREASFQSQRLDMLMASQEREKLELDRSLVDSSKENLELTKTLRELHVTASEKEKKSTEKVEDLSHEVNQLKSGLILKEAKWKGREHSYRRTINELQTKVQMLEGKVDPRTRQHMKTVPGLQTTTEFLRVNGEEGDLPSTNPSRMVGRRLFTPSPTLPLSGCSPGRERGVSPRLTLKYPITSTPNTASRF